VQREAGNLSLSADLDTEHAAYNYCSTVSMPSSSPLTAVDPLLVRFAHSRVRPNFSGCGRRLSATLASLSSGELAVASLPPIAVISLPDGLLVSLNNRRLFVLQALARASPGRLPPGGVLVRMRAGNAKEIARYTRERCASTAKIMHEREAPQGGEAGEE
jgi:hypothetical protein